MAIVNQAANEASYRAAIQGGTTLATSAASYYFDSKDSTKTDPSTSDTGFSSNYNETAYAPGEESFSTGRSGDMDYI